MHLHDLLHESGALRFGGATGVRLKSRESQRGVANYRVVPDTCCPAFKRGTAEPRSTSEVQTKEERRGIVDLARSRSWHKGDTVVTPLPALLHDFWDKSIAPSRNRNEKHTHAYACGATFVQRRSLEILGHRRVREQQRVPQAHT